MRVSLIRGGKTSMLMMLVGLGTLHAVAQPLGPGILPGQELCPSIRCASVAVGPFAPPTGWSLKPDRRPGIIIHTWNGHPSNPIRVNPAWYDNDVENPNGPPTDSDNDGVPDVFEWLLSQLDTAYDLGYRRMIMRLPAGSLAGGPMSSSQWWPMPQWKRRGFHTHVKAWLKEKAVAGDPVALGVYAGYPINDPCELSMVGAHAPDTTNADDMCVFYQNVKPWMDVGVAEYWLDASSPTHLWPEASTLQHSPDYAGRIRFGGEAIPSVGDGNGCSGALMPNPAAAAVNPWVATYRFAVSRYGQEEVVDAATTDLAVMFNGHHVPCGASAGDEWEYPDLKRFVEEGWIAWTDGGAWVSSQWRRHQNEPPYAFDYAFRYAAEAVHRVYDFGTLTAVADFNNDGLLEVDDYDAPDVAAFLDAWYDNATGPGGYVDGDVNGDGTVDGADVTFFFNAANAWTQNGQLVGVDLGPAWWHP